MKKSSTTTDNVIKHKKIESKDDTIQILAKQSNKKRIDKAKAKCIKRGGTLHEHQNDNGFDCVYYNSASLAEKDDKNNDINLHLILSKLEKTLDKLNSIKKELSALIDNTSLSLNKNPRDWGKRKCIKNGGIYIESYAENGKLTSTKCGGIKGDNTKF